MQYSGSRILIEGLIEQGVDTVFGYPGGAVLFIYDELYKQRDRIRHILVSHEQHAAHAADGYARSTGKVGVCIATSGPGATNLITGIATAGMDSVPLVAITGNVSTGLLGKDSFQEVDIAGISMPVVKHNWIVKKVDELAEVIREAFIVAQSGRPGPVLIDIPKDISALTAEWTPGKKSDRKKKAGPDDVFSARAKRLALRNERLTYTDEDIENAAKMLKEAKRPVLYAGGGVIIAGAGDELTQLAERLNAPVALSLMGIGAIPGDHKLCTGLIGMHGTVASNKAVQKADLLVAIGARFSDRVTSRADMFAKTAKILHLDIDAAEINKNIDTTASVVGDVKETLIKILDKLPSKVATEWNGEIEKWKTHMPTTYTAAAQSDGIRKTALHPRFVIEETAKKLGHDTIAVTDVGQHQIWAAQFFPARKPRSFLSSGGLGTMGFGMGAAEGAKVANPKRPVVLFTGDGCFRMNCAEMGTLKTYSIPVLIVVFDNSTLGMVRQWQNFFYEGRYSETDLPGHPDFVKLADAYGLSAYRATDRDSFLKVLDAASADIAAGKAALIDAKIDKDEKVFPMVPTGRPIDEQIL
ncbi:biosynthetic-type acetolactate synthase large subunit [Leadbettera azotonutricia]|uniref:Acetolactate synthase n=1 Tax=Leadbettera azotonutricia (strain ATCC BAA-888 / DSM 13862 / ZAS-9) TaxID=545695 RepID=F5YB38_LEAAZ|nr:biosynthetic-type acetolactate synthase large subunit [Leadbettera azotonutricia]AEF82486.1 acetolactate synthase, large subunit, biosynthetic type [Leadbettera azotonutricia ZAS-9]